MNYYSKRNIELTFIQNVIKRIILTSCVVMLIIILIPVYAQTEQILTLETIESDYKEGDNIIITGKVSTVIPNTPITLQIFYAQKLVEVAQITVAQDGTFTHSVFGKGPLWNSDGMYTIRGTYGPGNIAETSFNFAKVVEVQEVKKTYEVDAGSHGKFDVEYTIKGGTVNSMLLSRDIVGMIIEITADTDGYIIIELPRKFIGALEPDGTDIFYIIDMGEREPSYEETVTNDISRTLRIDFKNDDTTINIIGTYVVPEFGVIASMIFVIGIILGIILLNVKRNGLVSPFTHH